MSLEGINAFDTPIDVEESTIGDQSTAVPGTPPDIRAHGVIASFFSPAACPSSTGCVRLTLDGNKIYSTGKDGIVANGLGGQPTAVTGNLVSASGTYGIRLVGADQLTLTGNVVNSSGIAANAYPAIYLNNVTGDFNTAITANAGAGNGLNALVFHGTVTTTSPQPDFTWLTPDPAGVQPLGYMLDGALTVNGNFKATGGVVKMLSDGITINGRFNSTGTIYTSLKENVAPLACNSVFVPTVCPSNVAPSDYWGGISVIGGVSNVAGGAMRNSKLGLTVTNANAAYPATPSTFSDLTIDHVTGNGIRLINSDATFSRDIFTMVTGSGNFAIKSAGGKATIDCSSFHDNANGVSFDGTSSIADSDAYNNASTDVYGTAGTTATAVWWGAANTGGNVSGVTVTELLSSQSPVFSDPPTLGGKVEILGNNPTATDTTAIRALGIGTLTVKLTSSRRMDPTRAPTITFKTITVGDPTRNVTGGSWNNRVWTSDPYTLNTTGATAGLNHLSVSGSRSCIPDGPNPAISPPASTDFNAAVLPAVVAVLPGATATYGGATTLVATLKSGGLPVANETVSPVHFTILDAAAQPFGSATAGTDGLGVATTAAISIAGLNASPPSYVIKAVFLGDNLHSVSNTDASQTLLINKLTPTIATTTAPASPVVTGTGVKDQAVLTGATSNAGGTVTYKLYSGLVCTGSAVYTSNAAAVTNGVVAQSAPSFNVTPGGSYTWQATYSGDTNNQTATSACGSDPLVVNNVPAVISSVSPLKGPVAGQTPVTITGTNMAGATAVTFGTVAGTIVSVSDTQIQAKSPPDAAGAVDILITTPSGTSTAIPADQFEFVTYAATIGADTPAIYWRLGESSGTAAVDASGNARDGTYTSSGIVLGAVGAPLNDTNTAVTLDGAAGAIREASGAGVPVGSSARSLEIWFKTSTASAQPLFNYGTSGVLSQFAAYVAGNQVQIKDGTDPILTFTAASSLSDGAWHHLVVTYDSATSIAVYVDGGAVGSAQATSGVLATVLDLTGLEVGKDNAAVPVFFNGTLDEAAVYGAALNADRVAAHFAAGQGG
jgi:hypothetical protein